MILCIVLWGNMSSTKFDTQLYLSRPYLTRKQVQRAQQNTIGDHRAYNAKRVAIVKFLSDICVQLRFPRRTLEAAVYFYLRYHLFNNFETEPCYIIATSCLVLSCKEVETIKKVNDICTVSLSLRNTGKVSGEVLENFKKRVFVMELKVLESCSFDYRINDAVHVDEYIIKFGKTLGLSYELCHIAWCIAFDVLKTELLLLVPQHVISLACIKLASGILDVPVAIEKSIQQFEMDNPMFSEAYFELLNFYINSFDSCDLKNVYQGASLEQFMDLKRKAGQEHGLKEPLEKQIEMDTYLTTSRTQPIRERRYVLSQSLVNNEVGK